MRTRARLLGNNEVIYTPKTYSVALIDILDGEEVDIRAPIIDGREESVIAETQANEDLAAMRRILRRSKRLSELQAGKSPQQHLDNIEMIRANRDGARLYDAGFSLPDLFSMKQPEPPPGVPDNEIEEYGPDGTFLRLGL